jgi:hypothetical protein
MAFLAPLYFSTFCSLWIRYDTVIPIILTQIAVISSPHPRVYFATVGLKIKHVQSILARSSLVSFLRV